MKILDVQELPMADPTGEPIEWEEDDREGTVTVTLRYQENEGRRRIAITWYHAT